jgi:group I intron endonuclease
MKENKPINQIGYEIKEKLPNKSGIYKVTNLINGKGYVGKAKNIRIRWYVHKGSRFRRKYQSAIYAAMIKYGINNFKCEVLLLLNNYDEEILNELEIFFIADQNTYYNGIDGWGYNLTKGGEGGQEPTDEVKLKISKALKGRTSPLKGRKRGPMPEEQKEKIRRTKANQSADRKKEISDKIKKTKREKPYRHTQEEIEHLRKINIGKKRTPEAIEKIRSGQKNRKPRVGFHHSEETKEKIRQAHKGKTRSEETKEKIRQTNIRKNRLKRLLIQRI